MSGDVNTVSTDLQARPYVLFEVVGNLGETGSPAREHRIQTVTQTILAVNKERFATALVDLTAASNQGDAMGVTEPAAKIIERQLYAHSDDATDAVLKADQTGYFERLNAAFNEFREKEPTRYFSDPDKDFKITYAPRVAEYVISVGTKDDLLTNLGRLGSEGPVRRAEDLVHNGGWLLHVVDGSDVLFGAARLRRAFSRRFNEITDEEVLVQVADYEPKVGDVTVVSNQNALLDNMARRKLIDKAEPIHMPRKRIDRSSFLTEFEEGLPPLATNFEDDTNTSFDINPETDLALNINTNQAPATERSDICQTLTSADQQAHFSKLKEIPFVNRYLNELESINGVYRFKSDLDEATGTFFYNNHPEFIAITKKLNDVNRLNTDLRLSWNLPQTMKDIVGLFEDLERAADKLYHMNEAPAQLVIHFVSLKEAAYLRVFNSRIGASSTITRRMNQQLFTSLSETGDVMQYRVES